MRNKNFFRNSSRLSINLSRSRKNWRKAMKYRGSPSFWLRLKDNHKNTSNSHQARINSCSVLCSCFEICTQLFTINLSRGRKKRFSSKHRKMRKAKTFNVGSSRPSPSRQLKLALKGSKPQDPSICSKNASKNRNCSKNSCVSDKVYPKTTSVRRGWVLRIIF